MVKRKTAGLLILVLLAGFTSTLHATAQFKMGQVDVIGTPGTTVAVNRFLGVPFAQAPMGPLRWAPPQAWNSTQTVYKADKFAPACFQGPHITNWYKGVVAGFGGDPETVVSPKIDEDCLYLNIYQPSAKADKPFPVIVFIHGGSNKGGWPYEPNYLADDLAAKGVIVVTIAYRLGVFGFFSHPDLPNSNFGLLDQVMALQWIQKHVGGLAGDPGNVTVMGESAGANNIGFLLASPLAQGLFKRVIHQSGGSGLTGRSSRLAHLKLGDRFAQQLVGTKTPDTLNKMRRIPAEKIRLTALQVYQDHYFDAVVDGHSVTRPLLESVMDNSFAGVDLLIGSNDDEWLMYLDDDPDVPSWLAENVTAKDAELLWPLLQPALEPARQLDLLITARSFVCPSLLLAARLSERKQQVWGYHFLRQRQGDLAASMGAYHGAELPYVFGTHDAWLPTDAIDLRLSDNMQSYWLAFAATGDPNGPGQPSWPSYRPNQPTVQILNNKIRSASHSSQSLCDVLMPN